uniref:Apple domain-containing protein n=1 Tax=Meloidogyne floridensis TaxID=298350 RepID=A0A915NKW5_9BILA
MIGAKPVREHSLCLQFCLETTKCKAVNYFESIGGKKDQKTGFCELLVETQYDNPRLMRPFRKATYYEKIKCRTSVEGEEATEEGQQQPFKFNSSKGKDLLLQQTSSSPSVERRFKNVKRNLQNRKDIQKDFSWKNEGHKPLLYM